MSARTLNTGRPSAPAGAATSWGVGTHSQGEWAAARHRTATQTPRGVDPGTPPTA